MDAREVVRRLVEVERKLDDAPRRREFEEIKEDIKALRADLAAAASTRHADWRQMVYAGLVPFAVGILVMLLSKGAK